MSPTRILIVDDEPDMRRSLRRIMRLKGYDVETAASGEEAVDRARTFEPDGVLMDVRMPGIDGIEAYRRIRVDRPNVFVCFITAHSDAVEQAGEQSSAVLTKPFDLDELCAVVSAEAATKPVLIVDDDDQFSTSLQRVLAQEGFRIETAGNVSEAIDVYARHPRAIVLLDIRLGASSGWDLLPQLQELNPDVSVIAISGHGDAAQDSAAQSVVFMPKPLDIEQLITTINSAAQQP